MPMTTDPLTLLVRALDQTEAIIVGIRDDQQQLPTPCRSWDVSTLVAHLIHDLGAFTKRASGGTPSWSDPAAVVEGSHIDAYRAGSAALVQAWRAAGDLSVTIEMPGMGKVAKRFPLDQQITELAVHGWDLAVATGQSMDLDPEVGETGLVWARTALRPEFRGSEDEGKAFGPEIDVPQDAPLYDRLAGFFGHRPT
ncbi:MAG TPA: TIGR03086 family metal-binding protein [Dermatophilaceae bacterium]|jgi:uncharacterized protein (TIGR03086 family)